MLVAAIPDLPALHVDDETIRRRTDVAERLFALYRLRQRAGNSPEQATEFVEHFAKAWNDDADGPRPRPDDVQVMADRLNDTLVDIWRRYSALKMPPIIIGSTLDSANPFVIHAPGVDPLIVMASDMSSLMFEFAVGAFAYACELVDARDAARWLDATLIGWLTNTPAHGPSGNELIRYSTLDRRNSEIAMGIAHAAFSWALYHEVGHVHLGHLPSGTARLFSAPGGGVQARIDTYDHANELAADLFGLEHLSQLMKHELEIRRSIEFGLGADHAPLMFFELVDFAYRRFGLYDQGASTTHPPPLDRARHLMHTGAAFLSADGRYTYENLWREALNDLARGLPAPRQ